MAKRKITAAILALAMLFVTFSATGCQTDPFEKTDDILFERLFNRENAETFDIRIVDAYLYKGTFYYEVRSSIIDIETNERVNFNHLFYGSSKLEYELDLKLSEFGEKENDYETFLKAKDEGEHKRLASEIINQKLDDSFHSDGISYVTIDPSDKDFEEASTPVYSNKSETISDQIISKPYEVKLFCYKVPVGGYYKIYSTGHTDTLGKIFKKNEFMGKVNGYEAITHVCDGRGTESNFLTVEHFAENAQYFVGVRGFSDATGSYTLKIEPNDDKAYSHIGALWINDNVTTGTASILYLNNYQVDELYELMTDEETLKAVRNAYKKDGIFAALNILEMNHLSELRYYPKDYAVVDYPDNFLFERAQAVLEGVIPTSQAVLSEIFTICSTKDRLNEVKEKLETICRASDNSLAVCGLKMNRKNDFWGDKYGYESFTGYEIYGELYERGVWY